MKFYDETKPLHLETDASGVRLGAALLQTRSGTSCPGDKVPDDSILRSITLPANPCQVQKEDTVTLKERH